MTGQGEPGSGPAPAPFGGTNPNEQGAAVPPVPPAHEGKTTLWYVGWCSVAWGMQC